MQLTKHGKPKCFHRVPGLTVPEYEELKAILRDPASEWPWLSHGEFLKVARSMLFYRDSYRKALRFVRLLTRTVPKTGLGLEGMSAVSSALVRFSTRNLYYLRDVPPEGAKVWHANKARYVKWMDDVVIGVIRSSVPEIPPDLAAMISRNLNFWSSKRLPGVDRKLKRGPRKGAKPHG